MNNFNMVYLFNVKNRKVETSLIEEFLYPKLGPGQLWETVAKKAKDSGVKIMMNTTQKQMNFIYNEKVEKSNT